MEGDGNGKRKRKGKPVWEEESVLWLKKKHTNEVGLLVIFNNHVPSLIKYKQN